MTGVGEGDRDHVNKVLLTGRLTRDPELRSLASGASVAQFSVATNEYRANGHERAEYHNVVVWDRLAEVCGQFLGKGQQVAIEGRIQTRQWEDDRGQRHWKTEIVASSVEMLSGRRKRDYEAQASAEAASSPESEAAAPAETPDGTADAPSAAEDTEAEAEEALVLA